MKRILLVLMFSIFLVACGDNENIDTALYDNMSIEEKNDALMRASYKTVKYLVKNGADINAQDNDGGTVLMYASLLGCNGFGVFEVVEFLVENGVLVNAKDNDGDTVLMKLSLKGNFKIVKYLVEAGADINATNNNGDTALMKASSNDGYTGGEAFEVVKYLIENGANISATNNNGDTALDIAKDRGDEDLIELLNNAGAEVISITFLDEKGWLRKITP